MLAGIGGRTIEEAKQRMTYAEFRDWMRYREKVGPLNHLQRADYRTALLASVVNRSMGGRAEITDFLPDYDQTPASPEDVFRLFTGAKS